MENTITMVGEKYKTCLITIVQPGLPDSVLRVYPADHETEKIWLDRRPGIERWESIKQLMQRFCPRGKYVPEPAYWHAPTGKQEDLNVLILKPEDIPVIQLDGAVLSAPPADDKISRPRYDDAAKASKEKIENLEKQVGKLTEALDKIVNSTEPEKVRRPGRPRKEAISE